MCILSNSDKRDCFVVHPPLVDSLFAMTSLRATIGSEAISYNKSIRNRHSAVFAKGARRNLHPNRRLAALVFVYIN